MATLRDAMYVIGVIITYVTICYLGARYEWWKEGRYFREEERKRKENERYDALKKTKSVLFCEHP